MTAINNAVSAINVEKTSMITIVTDVRRCKMCGNGNAIVYCSGCGIPLCEQCRQFDMYPHDCGSVDTLALCHICYDDIDKNPWGGKRPGELYGVRREKLE